VVGEIVRIGRSDSQVNPLLKEMIDRFGPRLTGSHNLMHAEEWARDRLAALGLNARLEQWGSLPVGFDRGPWHGQMLAPEKLELDFTTPAWTPGVFGPVQGAAIAYPTTVKVARALGERARDAWLIHGAADRELSDELRDKIGLRDPAKDEEVLRPAASGAAPAPGLDNAPNAQQIRQVQPNPTNAPDADDIDDMAASGASDWEPMMSPLVEKIETLAAQVAANGGGREEFIAGLGELFQDMDEAEMAEAFAAANFKARALGDANDDPAV